MKFDLICCSEKDITNVRLIEILHQYREYRILTNNPELKNILKNNGLSVNTFFELIPDNDSKDHLAYNKAKTIKNKYELFLKNLEFSNVNIFQGVEYPFLRKIYFLCKIEILLKDFSDTLIIFDNFDSLYFSINDIAKSLNYETHDSIKRIQNGVLEEISSFSQLKQSKTFNFFKKLFLQSFSVNKISLEINLGKDIFFLIMRKYFLNKFFKNNFYSNLTKKINKKIEKNTSSPILFFITASRFDLYFRPWEPVFQILKNQNIPIIIFTSDLVTSTILTQKKISHINLFHDMNIFMKNINSKILSQIDLVFDQLKDANPLHFNHFYSDLKLKIIRAYALTLLCDKIFKLTNPRATLVSADGEMLESLSCELSKNNNIPSFALMHGISKPTPIFSDWFHAEKIFVSGNYNEDSLIKLGYDRTRILKTGNPKYDYCKKTDPISSKLFLSEKYSIDINKKLIVIGMSYWHSGDEIWMVNFIKFCNTHNLEIIIKIHPKYLFDKTTSSKIQTIKNNCSNQKFNIIFNDDLNTILSASDLVITDWSNVGLESLLLEKPLLIVNFLDENYEFNYYEKLGAGILITKYSNLEKIVIDILENEKHTNALKLGRQKFITQFAFKNDGLSSQRIIDNILGLKSIE